MEESAALIAPAKENICAVMVTFKPDTGLRQRVTRIAAQVQRLVIVDNHSGQPTISLLRALRSRLGLQLILNETNLGIATALNQGVVDAIAHGFPWVLLFDQDTLPSDSMVDGLIRAYEDFPDKHRLAVVGSNFLDPSTRRTPLVLGDAGTRSWVERKAVITSGSLIPVSVFQIVGRFREEFFIDDVDSEYCLRARARGFKVIVTREPLMTHAIGAAEERRFLWRTVRPSNHAAPRWYYMTRNPIVIAQEYWRTESAWVLANLYAHLKWMAKTLVFERGRASKVKLMGRGVWHGVRRKLGRL